VDYGQLPPEHRRKDYLFAAIVRALAGDIYIAEWAKDAVADEAALEPLRATLQQRSPRVGDVVHYVSYGTQGGEYGRECRAAVVNRS
jgi:hypothetical protein